MTTANTAAMAQLAQLTELIAGVCHRRGQVLRQCHRRGQVLRQHRRHPRNHLAQRGGPIPLAADSSPL